MSEPIKMLLWCPECGARHVDTGEFATKSHHTHACQVCGMVWRPAIEPTCGVQFLPGFKGEDPFEPACTPERCLCAELARARQAEETETETEEEEE